MLWGLMRRARGGARGRWGPGCGVRGVERRAWRGWGRGWVSAAFFTCYSADSEGGVELHDLLGAMGKLDVCQCNHCFTFGLSS